MEQPLQAPAGEPGTVRSRRAVPSARPAFVVVAIAAVLLLLFGIGAALTGSSRAAQPTEPTAPVHGVTLPAVAAAPVLHPIERPGTPPADVLRSIVVPAGSSTVSSTPWDGETQFSAKMGFRVASSQAAVLGFYRAELRARGWSISSVGAADGTKGSTEVLAQRASTDGWYWEIGVVVSPTTFARTSATDSTRFSMDLFEEPQTG